MLLRPATRQIFLDLGYEPKTCSRLKHDSRDDEFLVSRIMFLTTYGTNINLESLIDEHHLAENININIVRHAKLYEEEQKSKSMDDPMEDMALIETLKLLFNVTHFCPQRSASFISSIPHVLTILCKRHIIPKNPLGAPLGFLVNSLINLDFEKNDRAINALFPEANNKVNVERMVELLKLAVQSYNEDEIEQQVSSLLTLLRKVYAAAPNVVKHFMKTVMLPSDDDRKQPLGKAETLSSKLLRLSTSPTAPTAREELSSLLFEMSDKDAKTFVQNVGYGFASGFLFQHNVPVPDDALEARSSAGSGDVKSRASSSGKANNPITGQNLESEEPYDGPEMTREEKEREAEKLMVLFERYVN